MPATAGDQWALVLAGGDGVRLQGLTRAITGTPIPKEYCRITGDRSMLEATLDRIAPIAATSRTLAIINRDHVSLAREQLQTLPSANVLIQERNRDTVEKPDTETAERIIRRGGLWNTFVMVFRLKSMLALLRRWWPADCEPSPPPREAGQESAPVWNFSRDFLARVAQELVALRVGDVGWSDWGTPEAIERTLLGSGVVPPWWMAERAGAMPAREETNPCV